MMKQLSAAILVGMLVVGSSGCISVHKTETHEARRDQAYLAASDTRGESEDGHGGINEIHRYAGR